MSLVQASIAAGSKLLIIVGAGCTGSYFLKDTHFSDLFSDLSKVLTKHLKDNDDDDGGGHDGATAALSAQVRRLAQELRQLTSAQGRPIIVNSDSRGNGGILSTVLPVAFVGAAGYGYMWWKGWSLTDLMYVTKKSMSNAVESMTKQMEGLTGALAATKRQISGRLDGVAKTVNETATLAGLVKDQLTETKADLGYVGKNVTNLQDDMQDVKGQLTMLESKQDFANQGIILLCRFVADGLEGNPKAELVQGLHAYSRGAASRSISVPSASTAGLKLVLEGLEGMVDKVPATSASSPSLLLPSGNGGIGNIPPAPTHSLPPRPGFMTRSTSCRT